MITTLTKIGDDFALVLDKPLMESLHMAPGVPLEVTSDGEGLHVRPAASGPEFRTLDLDNTQDNALFEKVLEETNREYADVFRKLAE